ncbi:MAG: HK97 gp10 family phage protein [Clostridiales bacterium]|nr:HK97 gp10 family phage protein [Clostridiales bacterium]
MGVKGKPFEKTESYLSKIKKAIDKLNLDNYGKLGVEALRDATPKDSGESADAWNYEVVHDNNGARLIFTNDHVVGYNTVPVVILIQYGHLTKGGVYVEGRDFINPAIAPIYDSIANKIWKEVTKV